MTQQVRAWTHYTPPFPSTLAEVRAGVPEPLGAGELVVQVYAAALNPVDVQLANLALFRLPALQAHRGLGCDFAGKVVAVGSSARAHWTPGDAVMGVTLNPLGGPLSGTLSELAVVDLARSCVVPKPAHLSFAEAASVPLAFLTAKTALSPQYLQLPPLSSSSSSSTIVVLGGATAVGIYVVQYARRVLGLDVVATASPRNAAFVESLGATTVVDYTRGDVLARLVELRPRSGYASIVDCVGGTELVDHLAALLSPRDAEAEAGVARGGGGSYTTIVGDKSSRARDRLGGSITTWWSPRQALRTWKGWCGWGPRYYCISLDTTHDEWLKEVDELTAPRSDRDGRGEGEGKLRVVIDDEFAFDQVPQAFEKLASGTATGKIVVNVKKVD
ncbi:hypothetical protein JCM11491_003053 [Sporobolomyces phaffii]